MKVKNSKVGKVFRAIERVIGEKFHTKKKAVVGQPFEFFIRACY